MDGRIKLSRTDVFLLVLTVLFLLTVGAVYLLTPHTVRKDYTVEAQVPVEAPAEERVDINTADADELDAALARNEITPADHAMARAEADHLLKTLVPQTAAFFRSCAEARAALLPCLE